MALSNAYNHAETLQKLERLNQLETVTAEQRIRIEKYRTMYETLKAEHDQMEDDKHRHNTEVDLLKEEMKALQSRCQDVVAQARNERDMKTDECEELRMQIVTPQKMEVLKIKLQDEVEGPYKKKLEALETEVDKYRNEFNRLRYDYSFLRSEYEHELTQKKTISDEVHGKHNIEKENLQKQITSLNDLLNKQDPANQQKTRMLQKENTQLNLRVKALLCELEELRDKKETANLQTDQASRLQARQLSELTLQCKSLEAEKEIAKLQLDRLQKGLVNSVHEQDTLSTDLHRAEKENLELKSQVEEITHTKKMELNNLKLSLMKDRSELERDRDSLRVELNMYKNKATISESNLQELKNAFDTKEQEIVKRVQAVKEEEWSKVNKLESTKAQLESHLSSMEQQKLDAQNMYKSQLDQLENELKGDRGMKEKYEKELSNTKSILSQERQKLKDLHQENDKLFELKQKHQRLVQNYESVLASEQEIKNDADKMLHTIELLKKELEVSQEDIQKQRELHQKNILATRDRLGEERKKLQERMSNLQKEHKDLKQKHEKLSHAAKKKTKKLKLEIASLNEQVQVLKTKEDHNELEKKTILKNMSFEQERMKRKFDKFRHRQTRFSQVLNATNMMNCFPDFSPVKQSSFHLRDNLMPPKSEVSPIGDAFETTP